MGDFGEPMVVSQTFAQLEEEGVFAGVGEVAHFDAGGIAPPTRAAAGDGENPAAVALGEEQGFVFGGIDGIDDGIEALIENFRSGFLRKKLRYNGDVAGGVDGAGAFGHGLGFLASDLAVHGVELAVDVGDADFIEIHESEVSDAGSGKRLHGPGSHAADADDGDSCSEEAFQRRLAVEPGDAAKTMEDGIGHGGKMRRRGFRVTTESMGRHGFLIAT